MSTRVENRVGVGRRSVLVIDDSALTRSILREELEAEGYDVQLAENGDRGLALVRDTRPDIVLLDVELTGKSGIEICREIKQSQELSQIPVLFLSARNELKDKLAGLQAGADDYLTKPFFTKELLVRLRNHLRVQSALAGSRELNQFYLEMLFGIGSAIVSPFRAEDDVELILHQALRVVGERRGAILLLDPDVGSLEVRGAAGYDGEGPQVGDRFRISDKVPWTLADPGGPIGISIYEDAARNTVYVPMMAKSHMIGGIEIQLERRGRKLSANEQKVLYALASQAGMFLQNARLERDVRSMFLNVIVSLAGAVDAKDAYTHGHSLRVARTALVVGRELGLRERLEPLLMSAILHDVGKIAVPDRVLKKPGPLDDEEFEIMKEHPVAGARMLAHIPALEEVLPGIRYHHEAWDGSGYPDGLSGEEIPLFGRIILIGDAFDAITTDRIYRKARPVRWAMEQIERCSGVQFDPACAGAVLDAYRRGGLHDDMPAHTPTLYELIDQLQ